MRFLRSKGSRKSSCKQLDPNEGAWAGRHGVFDRGFQARADDNQRGSFMLQGNRGFAFVHRTHWDWIAIVYRFDGVSGQVNRFGQVIHAMATSEDAVDGDHDDWEVLP